MSIGSGGREARSKRLGQRELAATRVFDVYQYKTLRKLSLICAVAVALLFPIQTFAAHSGRAGWHGGPGWAGSSVPDGAVPDGAILDGMEVPDEAGIGGVVAGGEVMA
jgi:hypothetical protein